MESVAIYLIKSCGLLLLFFIAYHFLLRKETFFTTNRWFLLAGLITATILPLVVFTKIIWVEPSPVDYDWSSLPIRTATEKNHTEEYIYLGLALTYSLITLGLLTKFGFDFYSLRKIFKGKTIERQADFKFIDISENLAPFSYFNTIVYNSSLYSSSELQNILEHEKVHSEQNHTVDVLISRIFCVIFWFNPFIWMYKKAILQNLEFIADSEATKKISDKKAYQLTLLKITTHENCVAITNHFYQSLIKKRIVMLNKNQSSKRNSWKYAVILPALVAFVLFFQIETIAQEKSSKGKVIESSTAIENSVDVYKINKNTTDEELKEKTTALNKNYGIKAVFSSIKRNSKNELIAIKVNLQKGEEKNQEMAIKGTEAINTFGIIISKNENGILTIDFAEDDIQLNKKSVLISPNAPLSTTKEIFINGVKASQKDLDKLDPNDIKTMDVSKNNDQSTITIITNKNSLSPESRVWINDKLSEIPNENKVMVFGQNRNATQLELEKTDPSYLNGQQKTKSTTTVKIVTREKNGIPEDTEVYIDGKRVSPLEAESMSPDRISSVDVKKEANSNKNSIRIVTKSYVASKGNMQEPPTPPTPPTFNFKAPKALNFPKAPIAPKGSPINGDKKAWASFNERMEDFNKKMEAMAPQIEAFDQKMAEFDQQIKPFTAKMELFEKNMKIYEKQLEDYHAKMKE